MEFQTGSSNMEFEEDKKIDVDEPIDLEAAANTLIEMGLRELQPPQPEKKLCLQKKGKKKTKSQRIPTNMHKFITRILNRLAARNNQVKELKEKIRSMEQNPIVNVEKPTFSDPQNVHPLNFMENLMAYIENNPSIHSAVDTAIDCLYGNPRNWANILKPSWKNFDDFKKDFLQKYWGDVEQSLLRKQISNGRWDRNTETMCGHFAYLIAQAKWLTHEIPERQLVYEIMCHYPKSVQMAWCVRRNRVTIQEAIEFLQDLDDVEKRFNTKKYIYPNTNSHKMSGTGKPMQWQQGTQINKINKFTQTKPEK